MSAKVAVVTGSNKGIGYAIVRELLLRGVSTVYLTARDEARGKKAVEQLNKEGLKPHFYQLDVTNEENIIKFASHLKQNYGGLDILINNAAIIPKYFFQTIYEDAKNVIDTNYRSNLLIQTHIFPILKDNARVVNMSSAAGHISNLRNPDWIKRLTNENVTLEDINEFVDWFLESLKNGTMKKDDFRYHPVLSHRIAKIAICTLTRLQQREVGRGISVNSLHPGFVQTDMTNGAGHLTVEESTKAPVYMVLDMDQSVKGKFIWFDNTEVDWTDPNLLVTEATEKDFEDSVKKAGITA